MPRAGEGDHAKRPDGGKRDPPCAPLRRAGDDDEFLVPARRVASGGVGRARRRARASGIGIADRNTLAGVVRAHVYARENREALGAFRVVTGARLAFVDGAPDVLVYPQDRAAYGRLSRLLSRATCARRKASAI